MFISKIDVLLTVSSEITFVIKTSGRSCQIPTEIVDFRRHQSSFVFLWTRPKKGERSYQMSRIWGHCCCSRAIAVAPGTLLVLQGHCCSCYKRHVPISLLMSPSTSTCRRGRKKSWSNFSNTRVPVPGMVLAGSAS